MNRFHISSGLKRRLASMLALLVLLFPVAQAQQAPSSERETPRPSEQSVSSSDSTAEASGQAKESGNSLVRFFRRTTVEGYIDTYGGYNFNRPASRENLLRAFDIHDRRFSFNAADIAFEKKPTADSRLGFRLDFIFGPAADYLNSDEPGNLRLYKNLHQAYLSYLVPVGKGLQLDFGKFTPWQGAEEDDVLENWNYSRGLLYNFSQPTFHAGLRAQYDFSDKVNLLAALVNGWGNIEENNGGKTLGLSLTLTPVEQLSLTQSYTVGPEQPGDSRHRRHLLDSIVTYDFSERLRVMGNYDYGLERLAEGGSARWQGVAGYLRYELTKRIAFSPRFELYYDYDGYTSGTAQRLKELTLTGEYKFSKYLLTRVEYRKEWSNQAVFERGGAGDFARSQATLVGGMVWSFSTRDEKKDTAASAATNAPAQTSQPTTPENPVETLAPTRPRAAEPQTPAKSFSVESIRTTDSLPQP